MGNHPEAEDGENSAHSEGVLWRSKWLYQELIEWLAKLISGG